MVKKSLVEIIATENKRLQKRIDELESRYANIVDLYLKTDRLYKEAATELLNYQEASKVKRVNGQA